MRKGEDVVDVGSVIKQKKNRFSCFTLLAYAWKHHSIWSDRVSVYCISVVPVIIITIFAGA